MAGWGGNALGTRPVLGLLGVCEQAGEVLISTPPDLSHFSLPQTVPGALRLFVNGEVGKCLARQRPPVLGQVPQGAVK